MNEFSWDNSKIAFTLKGDNLLLWFSEKRSILKGKNLLLGSKFFPFRTDICLEGEDDHWCSDYRSGCQKNCEMAKRLLSASIPVNSFGAKFQTTFVVCFFILTNYRLERRLYVKLKDWISNSVDQDETAPSEGVKDITRKKPNGIVNGFSKRLTKR